MELKGRRRERRKEEMEEKDDKRWVRKKTYNESVTIERFLHEWGTDRSVP